MSIYTNEVADIGQIPVEEPLERQSTEKVENLYRGILADINDAQLMQDIDFDQLRNFTTLKTDQ